MARRVRTYVVVLVVIATSLALSAGPALAQDDPSTGQYGSQVPEAEEGTAASDDSGDSGLEAQIAFLPFTGYDLLIVGGIALVLTGTGFLLRRAAAPRGPIS